MSKPRAILTLAEVLAIFLFARCAPGRSSIYVDVDSQSPLAGIDHLDVTISRGLQKRVLSFSTGRPFAIPPRQSFSLVFEPSIDGNIDIAVQARDTKSGLLGSGTTTVDVHAGEALDASVTLTEDASPEDMSPSTDLAADGSASAPDMLEDAAADLTAASDATPQNDQSVVDQTTAPDLTMLPAGKWTPVQSGTINPLFSISGTGPNNIFAAGANGTIVASSDGKTFATLTNNPASTDLHGIWTSSPDGVNFKGAAVGLNGTILTSYDGMSWTPAGVTVSEDLFAVSGILSSELVAAGASGRILYNSWTATSVATSATFTAVASLANGLFYVVGTGGRIYRSTNNGSTWTALSSGTTADLNGIWAASPTDIFAVGGGGTLLHSTDGVAWAPLASNRPNAVLHGIWGSTPDEIYAVGSFGLILYSNDDGQSWATMKSGTGAELFAIWGAAPGNVYAAGASGTIAHFE